MITTRTSLSPITQVPTPDEWHTIYGALRVAVEQYRKDAEACGKDGIPRLQEEFERTAKKCEDLLDEMDQAGIQ